MQYSPWGKNGQTVSRLGFGCMRLPTGADGAIDRAAAAAMIDTAYRAGVNYFDTAYVYHDGESERFLAQALAAYPRESFQLATKLPIWNVETAADVDRLFDEQLEKCGVDYFDVYLVHAIDRERWARVRALGVYEKLLEKKRAGLIGQLGFSYHGDYETFCECLDTYDWDVVQIQINYIDDTMLGARAFHDKLCERGIPCIVMEPVRGGFLANLPETASAPLRAAGPDPDAAWAMRWVLDLPNTPVILSGMSTPEQLAHNLALFSEHRPLTAPERAAIERARDALLEIKTIPCTACGYCMDCPFGVDIPGVFRIYNQYMLFRNPFRAKGDYGALAANGRGQGACTRCGACSPHCPQAIAIPERLADIHAEIESLVTL